jgi:type II secretory pathway pseudopilin PulG
MAASAHHGDWIPQEAAMAAITFNTTQQKEQARKQLKAALAAYREMLDVFVSDQMRQTAAEAEHARPRQTPSSPATNAK